MWSKYKIEDNRTYACEAGYHRFWVQKYLKTWKVYHLLEESWAFAEKGLTESKNPPDNAELNTIIAEKQDTLFIMPALPDRPVILKPDSCFRILPGMSTEIFVSIPLWIQFMVAVKKPENIIFESAITELLSTWFGEPSHGILAYALGNTISEKFEPASVHAWEAVCTVKLKNESSSVFNLQRLNIHCEELNLYQGSAGMFTNEIKVRFRGEEQYMDVQAMSGHPFAGGHDLKQISTARVEPSKNLLHKSFSIIKSFTQY